MSLQNVASRDDNIRLLQLLHEQDRRKAKKELLSFTTFTKPDYLINWHHKEYAEQLDQFAQGNIKKLMVCMPPQHGKSELSTRRLPAYLLGRDPNLRIAVAAYNTTFASEFNRDIQRIIDNDVYREVFQDTKLAGGKGDWIRNNDKFEIVNHKGSLVSVGAGGGLTGKTVDVAIIDDIYKDPAEAWSETVRQSKKEWYEMVLKTRLHNDSQQLIVMTRWHEEDLCGWLLQTEDDWRVIKFPAIDEEGQALWPEKHSLETLEKIRDTNPIVFESLYQQNPTPKEGLLLPSVDVKRFNMNQLQGTPDGVVSVCDIADEGDDSTAAPIAYVYGDDKYIVDVVFSKEPIEVTQPLIASMYNKYKVDKSQFESNFGGKGYAQTVKALQQGRTIITWKPTTKNKHTRILMKSGQIKENVYFLEDADQSPEYRKFFYELTHYPKNGKVKHDDAIDSVTMLEEFTTAGSGWGWRGKYV